MCVLFCRLKGDTPEMISRIAEPMTVSFFDQTSKDLVKFESGVYVSVLRACECPLSAI